MTDQPIELDRLSDEKEASFSRKLSTTLDTPHAADPKRLAELEQRLAALERRLERLEKRVTAVVHGSGALIGRGGT